MIEKAYNPHPLVINSEGVYTLQPTRMDVEKMFRADFKDKFIAAAKRECIQKRVQKKERVERRRDDGFLKRGVFMVRAGDIGRRCTEGHNGNSRGLA